MMLYPSVGQLLTQRRLILLGVKRGLGVNSRIRLNYGHIYYCIILFTLIIVQLVSWLYLRWKLEKNLRNKKME